MNADLRVQCLQRNISKILFIPHHRQTDMNPIQRLYYFSSVFGSERFHRDRGDANINIYFTATQYPGQLARTPGESEPEPRVAVEQHFTPEISP